MPECNHCDRPARGRGLCQMHWLRWRRHGNPLTRLRMANRECSECSIEGCTHQYHARGWCNMHYLRWRAHGDPLKVLQEQVPHEGCSVDGCKRPHYGKKMCNIHYYKYVTRPRLRTKYDAQVVDFTPEQWQQTLEDHDYLCAYCGGQADLEQDHVLPISKGGNHTASNIVPACRSCNARKSDSIGTYTPTTVAA